MEIEIIDARLSRVEAECRRANAEARRWRRFSLIAVCLLFLAISAPRAGAFADAVTRAPFTVVEADGEELFSVRQEDGVTHMYLASPGSEARVEMSASSDGSTLRVASGDDGGVMLTSLDDGNPMILTKNPGTKAGFIQSYANGLPYIDLFNSNGAKTVKLGTIEDGSSFLALSDYTGKVRGSFSIFNGRARLQVGGSDKANTISLGEEDDGASIDIADDESTKLKLYTRDGRGALYARGKANEGSVLAVASDAGPYIGLSSNADDAKSLKALISAGETSGDLALFNAEGEAVFEKP